MSKSERTIALRSQIQQARVQLAYFARNRCTSVRSELQEDASSLTTARLPEFETYVGARLNEVVDRGGRGTTAHFSDVATEFELTTEPPAAAPPPTVAGAAAEVPSAGDPADDGAGRRLRVGGRADVSRLLAGLASGLTIAGLVAGGVVGLLLTVWVVGMRGLFSDRAVLDRWVGEVTSALQSAVEERVPPGCWPPKPC